MIDLKAFVNKPCIVTFRTGMKMWSYIYDDGDGEYSIRIEHGWYQSYKPNGQRPPLIGYTLNHEKGTKTPMYSTVDSADIIDIIEATFDEADEIAKREKWAEQKSGRSDFGWNNYVLFKSQLK